MLDKRTVAVAVAAGVMGAAVGIAVHRTRKRNSKPKRRCPTDGTLAGLPYTELVVGDPPAGAKLPLVVAFHGRGATGALMAKALEELPGPARILAPDGPEVIGSKRGWWQLRSVAPDQGALEAEMRVGARKAKAFVDAARRCFPTSGKPILVGHSQGGMMAATLAALYPMLGWHVAAAAWLPTGLQSRDMGHVVFIHGTGDETVPFERTRDMLASLDAPNAVWVEVPGKHGFSNSKAELLEATQHDVEKYVPAA